METDFVGMANDANGETLSQLSQKAEKKQRRRRPKQTWRKRFAWIEEISRSQSEYEQPMTARDCLFIYTMLDYCCCCRCCYFILFLFAIPLLFAELLWFVVVAFYFVAVVAPHYSCIDLYISVLIVSPRLRNAEFKQSMFYILHFIRLVVCSFLWCVCVFIAETYFRFITNTIYLSVWHWCHWSLI